MSAPVHAGLPFSEVEIILDPATALRMRAVYWGTEGRLLVDTDGTSKLDDEGPVGQDAARAFYARRRRLGHDAASGPEPRAELRFRLAAAPDLGELTLTTGSWSFAQDLARDQMDDEIKAYEGPILATLKIEPVSFVAKNGPMKGQEVNYNKPVLTLKGAAPEAA